MPLASKWLDMVVGVDFHLELVPPSPVPVPFPHPFVGMIWDPLGYVVGEILGSAISLALTGKVAPSGPVLVNSLMGTVTGDETKVPFGHIVLPPGTAWAPVPRVPLPEGGKKPKPEPPLPPPANAMLLFGSETVEFRGSKAVRAGEFALPCSDPVRLPTGKVVSVPVSPNLVLVGGPPAVDWMMLAFAAGIKAVRNKWTSALLHGGINKIASKLNLPTNPGRFRQFLHDAVCFVTGHPVNVANGCLHTTWSDFELPGPIPLSFSRRYRSGFCDRDSPIGYGWSHSLDQQIWIEPTCVVHLTDDGRELEFDTFDLPDHVMRKGDEVYDPVSRLTLRSLGQFRWELESHDGIVKEFGPVPGEDPKNRDRGMARLLRIRNRQDDQIQLGYDDRARLSEVLDSAGRRIVFEYDRQHRLKHLWLPSADGEGMRQHAHFLYSEQGDLVEARDATGKPVRFEYDRHLMVRETDRNGLNFYFAYDGWGPFARCVRTWGDDGLLDHVLTYDRKNGRTLVTNSLGHHTLYEQDEHGLITKVVDARGGETTHAYDENLRKVKETDPLGNAWEFRYDERGNRIAAVAPDGATAKSRFDPHNDIVWHRTPAGHEWHWRYDNVGRLRAETNPLGQTTLYHHESKHRTTIEDPAGLRTQLWFDGSRSLAEVVHPDGTKQAWHHDALGRVLAAIDPKQNARRFVHDALGRVVRVQEPDGNVRLFEYDGEDNVTRARDRLRDIQLTYRGMAGQVASRTEGGATVRYEHDTELQLTAVVNEAGNAYRFERDPNGEVLAELSYDGVRRLYERDAAGRVKKVYRPGVGRTTAFEYDSVGRTVAVAYSDGTSERWEYDEDGNVLGASNDVAAVRFERDALGRVVKEWQGEHCVESHYDHRGDRIGIRSSLGFAQTIERDAMGGVIALHAKQGTAHWQATFRRDALGLELERSVPGGVTCQWWRDAVGRPTQQIVGSAEGHSRTPLLARRYQWGVANRLLSIDEDGFGVTRFAHDARGRFVAADLPDGSRQIRAPDEAGNLFRNLELRGRQFDRNGALEKESTPEGVRTYRYDPEGNLVRRDEPDGSHWEFKWDGAGQLAKVVRPDGAEVTFGYDALGRRTWRAGVAGATGWIWDGNVPLHEQRSTASGPDAADTASAWVFEPGTYSPAARLVGGSASTIFADHIGTPLCLVDDSGSAIWQQRLDPWGRATYQGAPDSCAWRFPGQHEDAETGLYYNRFRYYDPDRGDYLSRDPIGLRGGHALYGYVGDPNARVDPLGLSAQYKNTKGGGSAGQKLFHGTDVDSFMSLIDNPKLDVNVAMSKKVDGPIGFFLADELADAEFFAARRGRGAVLEFELSAEAKAALEGAGAKTAPIPRSAKSPYFVGNEFLVPPEAFSVFNSLLKAGKILVRPAGG